MEKTKKLRGINNGVTTLNSTFNDLSSVSEQMSQGAAQTSVRAGTVASASEEASTNVSMVATALDELYLV